MTPEPPDRYESRGGYNDAATYVAGGDIAHHVLADYLTRYNDATTYVAGGDVIAYTL